MTKEQAQWVKRSWRQLEGINPETIAELFYARLFADRPALRRMFPSDMREQYRKLMEMLDAIVLRLDHLEKASHEIAALAERHKSYGVKPVHYQYAGKALLWTLEKALGADWTPEVAHAWEASYQKLSELMVTARPFRCRT